MAAAVRATALTVSVLAEVIHTQNNNEQTNKKTSKQTKRKLQCNVKLQNSCYTTDLNMNWKNLSA